MCRYINAGQLVCDSLFGLFLVSWFVTRHVLFIIVIVSTYTDLPRLVPFEWSPHLGKFLSREYWIIFCACLTALQVRKGPVRIIDASDFFLRCRSSKSSGLERYVTLHGGFSPQVKPLRMTAAMKRRESVPHTCQNAPHVFSVNWMTKKTSNVTGQLDLVLGSTLPVDF
jgi:hypothetical protein